MPKAGKEALRSHLQCRETPKRHIPTVSDANVRPNLEGSRRRALYSSLPSCALPPSPRWPSPLLHLPRQVRSLPKTPVCPACPWVGSGDMASSDSKARGLGHGTEPGTSTGPSGEREGRLEAHVASAPRPLTTALFF